MRKFINKLIMFILLLILSFLLVFSLSLFWDYVNLGDLEADKYRGPNTVDDPLFNTTYLDKKGNTIVKNLDDNLILVNKSRLLPIDYMPKDLSVPKIRFTFDELLEKKYLKKEAGDHLEDMFEEAEKNGFTLYGVSGFRSYRRQEIIYGDKENMMYSNNQSSFVAPPGHSEHQTGLTMDISCKAINFNLSQAFATTKEGLWVKDNAHRFGYIIRYPEGKEDITGYAYEPWHLRYIGLEPAKEVYENNLCLEEYLGFVN